MKKIISIHTSPLIVIKHSNICDICCSWRGLIGGYGAHTHTHAHTHTPFISFYVINTSGSSKSSILTCT